MDPLNIKPERWQHSKNRRERLLDEECDAALEEEQIREHEANKQEVLAEVEHIAERIAERDERRRERERRRRRQRFEEFVARDWNSYHEWTQQQQQERREALRQRINEEHGQGHFDPSQEDLPDEDF